MRLSIPLHFIMNIDIVLNSIKEDIIKKGLRSYTIKLVDESSHKEVQQYQLQFSKKEKAFNLKIQKQSQQIIELQQQIEQQKQQIESLLSQLRNHEHNNALAAAN
jgi:hypothetical protein